MTRIRDGRDDPREVVEQVRSKQARTDAEVRDLIKAIKKSRAQAAELARLDVKHLAPATREMLAQFMAAQLRGQIPEQVAKGLLGGNVETGLLEQLCQRLANTSQASLADRIGRAVTPEAARLLANEGSVPEHALRWVQFVQRPQQAGSSQLRQRGGSAPPKGEMARLLELLVAPEGVGKGGAGLRHPKLVQRALSDLSPTQRISLMRACFGEHLAASLASLGIEDPLAFVRAGVQPGDRARLASALGMSRAQLFALLSSVELLKIGPGRSGQLGMRPELLAPLRAAGVTMLSTLAALRTLSAPEFAYFYALLRAATGGFRLGVKHTRPVVKRDLLHWARAAARSRSDILLQGPRGGGVALERGEAQEILQAWYQEHLFYQILAQAQQRDPDADYPRRWREERDDADSDGRDDEEARDEDERRGDELEWEYDHTRRDELMCFWITDYNTDPSAPGSVRRMYVCIDPATGAIIPQAIEQEYQPK